MEGDSLVIVQELMEIDLARVIKLVKHIEESVLKRIAWMLLRGVSDIHEQGIVHRDLKPSNLLFNSKGVLKIGDFGLARVLTENEPGTAQIASRWYRSPESLFGSRVFGASGDCWAVGCILMELATKSPLFSGDNDIDQLFRILRQIGTAQLAEWPEARLLPDFCKINFPDLPSISLSASWSDCPPGLLCLCQKMLLLRPENRLTAKEALLDDWFFCEPVPAPIESIISLYHCKIPTI